MVENITLRVVRRLSDAALGLTVAATAAAVFLQVVFRFVLQDPVAWLDEFAGLIFAWMTLVGAAVVQRNDSHMSVDIFARLLPAPAQALLFGLRLVAMLAVLALLFWQGLALTQRMSFIEYPAMEISRGYLYAILPVCVPLIVFYLVLTAWRGIQTIRRGEPVFGDVAHIEEHQKVGERL
jgi:TRAP-type C4-dicarboxylate transport system permease small subunit